MKPGGARGPASEAVQAAGLEMAWIQRPPVSAVNGSPSTCPTWHLLQTTLMPMLAGLESSPPELDHPNICRFTGGCIALPDVVIVMEYCPKGSLMDVLLNDDNSLNWGFCSQEHTGALQKTRRKDVSRLAVLTKISNVAKQHTLLLSSSVLPAKSH
ncbi:uncharacterized protein LOC114672773 [Macaca mulatta]